MQYSIDIAIAKCIPFILFAIISGVQRTNQKDLVPARTTKTSTDAFYYFRDKLEFFDAKNYCEKAYEGEIFPSKINNAVTRRLQMMNTVFWFWAAPHGNSSKTGTSCRITKLYEMKVSAMNVSCYRNSYPFLCRIPFAENRGTSCGKGYLTLRSGRCVDVDECVDGVSCRGYHSKCLNLRGSFRCKCQHGMQGNGVDVCGYLHTFSHTVEASALPSMPMSRTRHNALQNRLLRAIGTGFVSKLVIRGIANFSNDANLRKVYYDVYAKVKIFNARKLQRLITARIRSGYADASWVSKWKRPETYKPSAVDQCNTESTDGVEITVLEYSNLKENNCTSEKDAQDGSKFSQNVTTARPQYPFSITLPVSTVSETSGVTTQKDDSFTQDQTTSRSNPVAQRFKTSPFDDILGNFVKALKSNRTFRISAEAFNMGRDLLLGTISSVQSDSSMKVSSNAMGSATKILDWLIENPGSVKSTLEEKLNLALKFEKLPLKINFINESSYSIETKMISLQVTQVASQNVTDVEYQTLNSNATSLVRQTKASLPSEVAQFVNESSNTSTRFNAGFLVYKNTSLFTVTNVEYEGAELPQVISVSISAGKSISNMSQPFWYQMPIWQHQPKKKTLRFFQCGFLNETTRNWSTQGCYYIPDTIPPNCTCNHLTNFALIVKNVEMLDDFALGIFGKIACSISVIALIWTLGCYISSREVRRVPINQIHIHMCFSLLCSYLVFLIGAERTENKKVCMSIAAILHFFLLSTWGWMTVEAVTMYRKLVSVFKRMKDNYVIFSALWVYSISLSIVIMTVTITIYRFDNTYMTSWRKDSKNFELFNSFYVSERLCWLRGLPLFVSFLGPIAISLVISYICFTRIMKAITCDRKRVKSSRKMSKMDEIKNDLTRAGAISAIMGLTWVFAIPLAVSDDMIGSLVFSWLFSIFNALQGFAIFIFFCVRRKDIRDVWMSAIKSTGLSRRSKIADVSFSQNGGTMYGVKQATKNPNDMVIRSIN